MIMVMAHRLLLDTSSSSPVPVSWSRTRSGGTGFNTNEANFDTNMVIILAALLCALICALGLNSVVRCALRCRRRFALETPDETAAPLAATGQKKSILKEIPVVVYGAAAAASSGFHIVATDCAICLGEFADGEKVRVLPGCYHGFHVRCIDTWLVSHPSCPTCRQSLLEQPPPPSSSDIVPEADAAGLGNGNSSIGQSDGFLVAVEEVG